MVETANEKARFWRAFYDNRGTPDRLALRELEGTPRLGTSVFLAFDDAWIASQEASPLESAAQIRFEIGQCFCEAMTHSASLTRQTTAGNGAGDVVLSVAVGRDQRLLDQHPQHRTGKEDFHGFSVDEDLA